MHLIELLALLGVLPFHFFYYATVSAKGDYGTNLFIAKHAGLGVIDEDEEAGAKETGKQDKRQWGKKLDEVYRSIFENAMKVLESLKFRCQPLFVEQPMCLIWRHETGNVRDDLVMCDADPEDYGLLQLFFNLQGTGDDARVDFYSFEENKWMDFFEYMGMVPTHRWPERPSFNSPLRIRVDRLPARPHWRDLSG
jgi:hypothetical protein